MADGGHGGLDPASEMRSNHKSVLNLPSISAGWLDGISSRSACMTKLGVLTKEGVVVHGRSRSTRKKSHVAREEQRPMR